MKRFTNLSAPIALLAMFLSCPEANGQICTSYTLTGGVNFWPNGRIPVVFHPNFPASAKPTVREAMKDWMKTGAAIAFVEVPSYSGGPYIQVSNSPTGGNSSYTGPLSPTEVFINVNLGVNERSHVVHELGHAIGYPHEQSRPDRDSFVQVQTNNITSDGWIANFEMVRWECWPPGTILTPYDYGSIMHYDWCLSSIAGCANGIKGQTDTMFAVDTSWQYNMGGWVGNDGASMSSLDQARIRRVYGKAIWVDVNSACLFANGAFSCEFPSPAGPYKDISSAVAAVENPSDPPTKLMIKTGTYTHNESQTLRIDKPMKLLAWENAVRIE
jgi:hypothetical protein